LRRRLAIVVLLAWIAVPARAVAAPPVVTPIARADMATVGASAAELGDPATGEPTALGRAIAQAKKAPTSALQLALILAIASLAPALVLTCTCFARFAIVFSFLRTGLATQGAPPSQVLVGVSLFMTFFVMAPVAAQIHERAVVPYMDGTINERQALELGAPPLRAFMLKRTRQEDLALFYQVSSAPRPRNMDDVPLRIAIPAFVLSELGTAFRMGLVVLLPFLIIDMVVATILMSLGMIMLPPVMVALPIKLLVFVAVDGWHLVVASLLRGVM
jgi:flagellar biosynthetic protein FliP